MPELRYNIATKEWVIIATDRAKRPEDFSGKPSTVNKESAANCPFCPGREAKTPPEIFAFRPANTSPNSAGWRVRVVPNGFAALRSDANLADKTSHLVFRRMDGFGEHEVIIETPEHDKIMATMTLAQVEEIFLSYRERYQSLARDPRFETIILFKNHGQNAGTSLSHPHSQLIAMPIAPRILRDRLEIAMSHFDKEGSCLYCDMIRLEKEAAVRLVKESDKFIAFTPFASRGPFETWVFPKKHSSDFVEITEADCRDLAGFMKNILERFYRSLSNPDFNFALYSAPCQERGLEYFHWNIKIFPRVSKAAGFELGSGMMINTVVPEAAAKYLREA